MSYQTEIDAATRRGKRIIAMQRGEKIPFPESAERDARPGNREDAIIISLVRGATAKIPGKDCFPPARQLAQALTTLRREVPALAPEATMANAALGAECDAIGPCCFGGVAA